MKRMRKYALVLLAGTVWISCGKENEKPVATAQPAKIKSDPEFRKFVRLFEYKTLPLSLSPSKINSEFLPQIAAGNKFGEENNPAFAHSTFKTNGEYVALITTVNANCDLPFISTYDRQGKLIDKKQMSACSTDCGFGCNASISIDNQYNIFVCDSITEQKCDGQKIIPGTRKAYVRYLKGHLHPDGKIELAESHE